MEWQLIETAPKEESFVEPLLLWNKHDGCSIGYWDNLEEPAQWTAYGNEYHSVCYGIKERKIVLYPSHWMPLPKPPQD